MFIKSTFHDYYDKAHWQYFADKSRVYNREPRLIDISALQQYVKPLIHMERIGRYIDRSTKGEKKLHVVGFCGKIYYAIFTTEISIGKVRRSVEYPQNIDNTYLNTPTGRYFGIRQTEMNSIDWLPLFQMLASPIFVFQTWRYDLYVNTSLNDVEFYRVMPHFIAAQTLDVFYHQWLLPQPPTMVEVSDVVKAAKHKVDFRQSKRKQQP